tara:strand:- start:31 stop:561 length:531 start_codon:yes stop_codon:yes gene_type:complete
MKLLKLIFPLIIVYLLSSSSTYSIEQPNIKNLVFYKENKKLDNIEFKNSINKTINLNSYSDKLIILNFWATWCAPCREEMPILNKLQMSKEFKNLKIFPINVGQEDLSKSKEFFDELNINNLKFYYDPFVDLPNKFSLRGLPTSILINKKGEEFARILGFLDFEDKNFINWLKTFD